MKPIAGEQAGGITTLEDKSLGCTQKAGCSSVVVDVLRYGERLKTLWLNLRRAADAVDPAFSAGAGRHGAVQYWPARRMVDLCRR